MKYNMLQLLGTALAVAAAQGGTRMLLVDHGNLGLLSWLDLGFAATVAAYVVVLAVGVALGIWARTRAKALSRRE